MKDMPFNDLGKTRAPLMVWDIAVNSIGIVYFTTYVQVRRAEQIHRPQFKLSKPPPGQKLKAPDGFNRDQRSTLSTSRTRTT